MGGDTDEQDQEWEQLKESMMKEFSDKWTRPPKFDVHLQDFVRYSLLGKGAFGSVYLVQKDGSYYAMKCLNKAELVQTKQVDHAFNEKKILACINFPLILRLFFAFQNRKFVFMVTDFIIGGELFNLLRKVKKFPDNMVRFYSSQVLLAFEYLHSLNIVYRDLKPENVLVNADGYIKVADLGFAKILARDKRAWTLCGTPDYMAPEIIMNKGYHLAVDWWAFGVFLYELSCGYPPFMQGDQMKTFEKIVSGKYKFPTDFKVELKALVRGLLQVDLSRRFGNLKRGISDIKEHPYYDDLVFLDIFHKGVEAPYKPKVKGIADVSNFDSGGASDKEDFDEPVDKYAKYFVDF